MVLQQSPSVVSKITDLYGHGSSSNTAGDKAAAKGSNSDDKAREGLSSRAGAAQERRLSRRRESSLRLNVNDNEKIEYQAAHQQV